MKGQQIVGMVEMSGNSGRLRRCQRHHRRLERRAKVAVIVVVIVVVVESQLILVDVAQRRDHGARQRQLGT